MFATGMLGMVVMSGDREKDVRRVVSVMNEIQVGGLNLEVVMDNEALQSLVNAALMKSNCRSFHPRHVAVARPQAKRLERFVGICREGVFATGALEGAFGVGGASTWVSDRSRVQDL